MATLTVLNGSISAGKASLAQVKNTYKDHCCAPLK